MKPQKSIYMNLRVNNIPDTKLSEIKSAVYFFREKINSILKDVELTGDVYYDFNLTDSELIDPEFDVIEPEPVYRKYRRRRV